MLKNPLLVAVCATLSLGSFSVYADTASPEKPSSKTQAAKKIPDATVNHSGKVRIKRLSVDKKTNVNGFLEVLDSKLSQETTVNGEMEAKESQFAALTVNGSTELKGVAVSGPAVINGKLKAEHVRFDNTLKIQGLLKAKDTAFKKEVTITAKEADLDSCTVQNIVIKKTTKNDSQTLKLKDTTIAGNVKFESGKGIIEKDKDSTIKGKVLGGKIET